MEIRGNFIYADKGTFIHRIGSDVYGVQSSLLDGDTLDNFEQVDTIPEPIEDNYNEQVVAKIREKYSVDDELALLRQRDTKPTEFEDYFQYVESVKAEVKK